MRREITAEGDRGRATRVATKYDAMAEITTDHFRGADLRLEMNHLGDWKLYGYYLGKMTVLMSGAIVGNGVVID